MNLLYILSTSSILLGISYVIRFALTFYLARALTPDQLGIYSWSVTAFGLLGIFVNFGVDFFLIRKIPEYRNTLRSKVGTVIKHTKKQININVFLVILVVIPVCYFSIYFFEGAAEYNLELIIIIFALPFAAYLVVYSTSLRAFDFPISAQWIDSILQTAILLLFVFVLTIVFGKSSPEAPITIMLVGLFVLSWLISFFIAYFVNRKKIKINKYLEPNKEEVNSWRKDQATIVFGILGWSFLGRSDVFLLAFLVSPSEVGAYFICLRLAEILSFFSTVAYYIWGGRISNMIQEKRLIQAQKILKKSSQLCISTSLAMLIVIWGFTEEILFFVNERFVGYVFLFKLSLLFVSLKASVGILHPMYYILGDQAFLGKLQWIIGIFFTFLVIALVPSYGLKACIFSLIFCQSVYILISLSRLKIKHNLSLSPI